LKSAMALGYSRAIMQTKKILCTMLGLAAGTICFTACDAEAPPVAPPGSSKATAPPKTLNDEARAALVEVVKDKDLYSRARRLATLIPTLGPQDVPVVKGVLEDFTIDLRGTELELMLRYWATHEPEDAARWAVKESPGRYRIAAAFSAVSTWAEADPETATTVAWEWVDEPDLNSIVLIALVRGWYAANDPPELGQFLRGLPAGIQRQRAVAAYIRVRIQDKGVESVKRWAESLSNDDEAYKLAVYRRVVDALSTLDIQEGVRWCETQCAGPYGDNMRNIIARNWVVSEGPLALEWLSTAPASRERDLDVRVTWALWSRKDRQAATDWMKAQTPKPWLEPIYPIYARLLSGEAPADAMKWAERIKNAVEREVMMIGVARVWLHLDEAEAEKWLLQSSLSEEALEKVRALLKEPTGRTAEEQPAALQ
jgi:hypothetical protein